MYTVLDPKLNVVGFLSNKGRGANDFWGDTISQQIADTQDILGNVDLTVDNVSRNIDVSGNTKNWNHTLNGISFNNTLVGAQVENGYYLLYQDDANKRHYLMQLTSVSEKVTPGGQHYKTSTGVNAALYDFSRMLVDAKEFYASPTGTQTLGSLQNILRYILGHSGWNVNVEDYNFPDITYAISDGASVQSVLQDIIKLFEVDVDAYVTTTPQGQLAQRVVSFRQQMGADSGVTIRYGKNMTDMTREELSDSIYTKLYVQGANSLKLNATNNGLPYIVDEAANKLYNPVGASSSPETFREGIVVNSMITDERSLLAWGKKQLQALNHPRINYTISSIASTEAGLGDTIRVQDLYASQKILLTSRVIQKTISFANPTTNTLVLGEYSSVIGDKTKNVDLIAKLGQVADDITVVSEAAVKTQVIAEGAASIASQAISAASSAATHANAAEDALSSAFNTAKSDVARLYSENKADTASLNSFVTEQLATTNKMVEDAKASAIEIGQTTAQNAQKALDEAKKDFTSSFASQASQTASMASDVTSKASQYASQAKSEAIAVATSADGVVRKEFKSTTDSMTATIQQVKSDADGGISKAQTTATQALDGLSTKVEKTEYNKTTGDLTSKINTTSDTAEKSKQDIADIKVANDKQDNRMLQIEKDATGVKQTVSDLQTVQGKQSGSISKLEQRADGFDATVTKVNNLAVGGRNYVQNSSGLNGSSTIRPTLIGATSGSNVTVTYPSDGILMTNGATNTTTEWYYQVSNAWANFSATPLVPGKQYTFSADVMGTVPQAVLRYGFNGGTGGKEGSKNFDINNTSWTRISLTVVSTATNTGLYFRIQGGINNQYAKGWTGGETLKFRYVKIEDGNTPTAWSPAPEDVDNATAKAQLTADQATLAINNYKTDADGRISKAQADIKVNADAIATKVAKTDYDKKTGDLTTSINKAQQTADSATQTIGTYKETNDKRVASAETNIKANADAIKLTVSKTDFDEATGKINGDISSLTQRADGFDATVAKVNNLAVGGRNYLLNSSGLNASDTARPSVKPNATTSAFANSTLSYSNDAITLTYTGTAQQEWYYALAESYKTYESANLDKTKQYTLSVDVKGTVPSVAFRVNNFYSASISINDTTWTRLKYTFKFPDLGGTNTDKFYIRLNAISGGPTGNFVKGQTLSFRNFKLEEGNVASDWTPAPEDIDTQLAQVKITADGVYQTVNNPTTGIATRLLTAEGSITTVQSKTNELTSKLIETASAIQASVETKTDKTTVLSLFSDNFEAGIKSHTGALLAGINADASGTRIAGKHIILDGEVTVNGELIAKLFNTYDATVAKTLTIGSTGALKISYTRTDAFDGYDAKDIPYTLSGSLMLNSGGLSFSGSSTSKPSATDPAVIDYGSVPYVLSSWNATALMNETAITLKATSVKGSDVRSNGAAVAIGDSELNISAFSLGFSTGSNTTYIDASRVFSTGMIEANSVYSDTDVMASGSISGKDITASSSFNVGGTKMTANNLTTGGDINLGWTLRKNGTGFYPAHFNSIPGIHIAGTNSGIVINESANKFYVVMGGHWNEMTMTGNWGTGTWDN